MLHFKLMQWSGKRKFAFISFLLIILLIPAVSAWRFLVVFGSKFPNWVAPSVSWLGLTLGFTLFWLAGLYVMWSISKKISLQQWLATLEGTIVFGLFGFLLLTPAGISRVTVELYAENVWKPDIFTMTWEGAGEGLDWDVPFSLPTNNEAVPATLEIIVSGQTGRSSGEAWLLDATWSDGEVISFDEFQPGGSWNQRQVDWGPYQNRPVWVSADQSQPAVLRWAGKASGPLTLLFAKHQQAREVTIRWNGIEQTFNLYAPGIEFQGVTLPISEPVVWRANLPVSALVKELNLLVEPNPGSAFPIIKKISILGVPGQILEASESHLRNALQIDVGQSALTGRFNEGQVEVTEAGIQLLPRHYARPFQLSLVGPLATNLSWSVIIPWLENVLFTLYLALIGSVVLGGLTRLLQPNVLSRVNIVVISLVIASLMGELGLQLFLSTPGRYYVHPLHQDVVFKPQGLIGIEGESHFITNSQGFRADEFSVEDDYRILAIGGSTTECLALDQTETWTQRLQDMLNENDKNLQIWVGNAGQSGRTMREHIMHMRYLLPQYPSIDAVVLLIGINDLSLRLGQGDDYNPNYLSSAAAERELIKRAFSLIVNQDPYIPYYKQSATWRLVDKIQQSRIAVQATEAIDVEDERMGGMNSRRELRQNATIIKNELPDLSSSLAEYERNINTIIDIAEVHNIRLILLTQPTLWRSGLTKEEQDLLWFGWGGNREFYYSIKALREGMSAYNEKLLEVCQQRQVECFDLTHALPKDTTVFFDDVHFNESGAEQMARAIADNMLRREPFK